MDTIGIISGRNRPKPPPPPAPVVKVKESEYRENLYTYSRNTKNPTELILQMDLTIAELEKRKQNIQQEINEKKAFVKAIRLKEEIKMSALYEALENNTTTFWTVKEHTAPGRETTYFEIKVRRKYFINTKQHEIIVNHYKSVYKKHETDIRISQFY
jgi:hypothetical protein